MGNFNSVFRSLRIEAGYTQDGLAEILGISRSAVSMYENGNREPDFETLEQIADLFQVDTDYLLGRTGKPVKTVNDYEPSYEDIQSLVARNGRKLSVEQKQEIIRTLLSD